MTRHCSRYKTKQRREILTTFDPCSNQIFIPLFPGLLTNACGHWGAKCNNSLSLQPWILDSLDLCSRKVLTTIVILHAAICAFPFIERMVYPNRIRRKSQFAPLARPVENYEVLLNTPSAGTALYKSGKAFFFHPRLTYPSKRLVSDETSEQSFIRQNYCVLRQPTSFALLALTQLYYLKFLLLCRQSWAIVKFLQISSTLRIESGRGSSLDDVQHQVTVIYAWAESRFSGRSFVDFSL